MAECDAHLGIAALLRSKNFLEPFSLTLHVWSRCNDSAVLDICIRLVFACIKNDKEIFADSETVVRSTSRSLKIIQPFYGIAAAKFMISSGSKDRKTSVKTLCNRSEVHLCDKVLA